MKLNNLTKGVIAFSVLSMIGSGALIASAAADADTAAGGRAVHVRKMDGAGRFNPDNLTDTQKADFEAKRAEMIAKFDAVKAALTASDYNAWVAAHKAINENCPLLDSITADNFSQYVEAMNLRDQSDLILKNLGVEGREMMGLGMGGMMGRGLGNGGGIHRSAQK